MPTHKGTSQTDITIGSGGQLVLTSALDWQAEGGALEVQVTDRSGLTDLDLVVSITARDAAGAELGALWLSVDASASGEVLERSRLDRYAPAPSGSAGTWPAAPDVTATRDWSLAAPGAEGTVAAELAAVGAATVVVTEQTAEVLALTVSFTVGRTVALSASVVFTTRCSDPSAAPAVDDHLGW